jgi:hypothetical protein
MARLITALVFAFGIAGVFVYAQELDKTLAGIPKDLEKPEGCPEEYPIAVPVKIGDPIDKNGDGIVCTDAGFTDVVDNSEGSDSSTGSRHVSGHGNFFSDGFPSKDPITKEPLLKDPIAKVLDISFSFHGIGINGLGNEAKGKFEYHNQTPEGQDLTVHGDVLCLSIQKNRATLIGIVTRSNDGQLPVDRLVTWRAIDNGEGSNAGPDSVSRLSPVGKRPVELCSFNQLSYEDESIIGGNIQVDEDETSGGAPGKLEEKEPEEKSAESWEVDGSGNFLDSGKKVVQDIAFSFKAIGEGPEGKFIEDVAKGDFEYRDQTIGGSDLFVKGEVVCASVKAKSVMLVGVVTMSNDKGLPVTTIVGWSAEDNGEAGGVDRVSRLTPIGIKQSKNLCSGKIPSLTLQPVMSGKVYVR